MKKLVLVLVLASLGGLTACGGSARTKGGGAKNPAAAKDAKEKAGSKATSAKSSAEDKGPTYEAVACDGSFEGVGFCSSDSEVIFCSGGQWWALDCGKLESGAVCALDLSTVSVDCYTGL
jgi:hypothetical protein